MGNGKDVVAAFPVAMSEQTSTNQYCAPFQEGMSLRDYFAIHADWDDVRHYAYNDNGANISRTEARYKYADRMIEARKK